ncbi:EAL domain-containing protein [Motilibacter aurantiacus]|uniref:EAL domain-containing protein n=1 Tax=Motilibacter aurantiacus TaxID=2714955 RepID=UPI00140BE569|nr:EAL domain-containing protein [Motilibacter aurantiacus]NHC46048.1 EAL domain-containing protein [Motilibacter aurantiacus]
MTALALLVSGGLLAVRLPGNGRSPWLLTGYLTAGALMALRSVLMPAGPRPGDSPGPAAGDAALRTAAEHWADTAGTNALVTAAALVSCALLAAHRPYPTPRACLSVGTGLVLGGAYLCVEGAPGVALAGPAGDATAYASVAHGALALLALAALVGLRRAAGPRPDFTLAWPLGHLALLTAVLLLRALSPDVFGPGWWAALALQALAAVLLLAGLLTGVARLVIALEKGVPRRAEDGHRLAGPPAEAVAGSQVSRREVLDLLTDGHLEVAVQPVVCLAGGKPVGLEALARFSAGPAGAPLAPAGVFAAAGEAGVGVELEVLSVRRALGLLDRLPAGLWLSVNVSPTTAASRELSGELFRAGPARMRRIVLELTEHAAVEEYDLLVGALEPLREAGVRVAVDDAGAGFASFRHVVRLRPDVVKLDSSLIAGIDADPVRRSLVASLLRFSADIGATVVAEGVETKGELKALGELEVAWGQGYLLGRPGCVAAVLDGLVGQRV